MGNIDFKHPAVVLSMVADMMENPETGCFPKADRLACVRMIRKQLDRIADGEAMVRWLESMEAENDRREAERIANRRHR